MSEIKARLFGARHLCSMDAFPRRLVLVDDDQHLLEAMRFAFETEGYVVTAFADGEALLRDPPREARTCLVVDARLPGVSGLEAIARLRAAGVHAPAILMTTHPTDADRRRAAAANVPIIEKPLLDGELERTIEAVLRANPT